MHHNSVSHGVARWGLAAGLALVAALATYGARAGRRRTCRRDDRRVAAGMPSATSLPAVLGPQGHAALRARARRGLQRSQRRRLAVFGGARIVNDTKPDGTTGGSLYMPSGSTAWSARSCAST